MRVAWKLLYCSALHGASFSGLLARVVDASPTLLLVRDKGGAVFGGIASSAWAKCGAFYGAQMCCVCVCWVAICLAILACGGGGGKGGWGCMLLPGHHEEETMVQRR